MNTEHKIEVHWPCKKEVANVQKEIALAKQTNTLKALLSLH